MAEKRFTILICTRDRRDSLVRCLESLLPLCADLKPEDWEVVVVDNGSTDQTGEAAEKLAREYPIELRVINEPKMGVSFARNTGLRVARGDFLVITDDDVTFAAGWPQAWADVSADADVVAGAAPIEPVFPETTESWFARDVLVEGAGPTAYYDAGRQELVSGPGVKFNLPYTANAGVRRSAALEVGGFREDLGYRGQSGRRRMACEDTDFFERIEATGGKIVYTPHARVFHHLNEDQATVDYYRRWHRGYGTAMERMGRTIPLFVMRPRWSSKRSNTWPTAFVYVCLMAQGIFAPTESRLKPWVVSRNSWAGDPHYAGWSLPSRRFSDATASVWGVCGNRSIGRTLSTS